MRLRNPGRDRQYDWHFKRIPDVDDGHHLTDAHSEDALRLTRTDPARSVVIPVFNEEAVIPIFRARLAHIMAGLGMPWEAVHGDDGRRMAP